VPDQVNLTEIELSNEASEVFSLDDRGVLRPQLVRIRVIIPAAVCDRAISLGERAKLAVPRRVVAERAMDEDDSNSLAALDVV